MPDVPIMPGQWWQTVVSDGHAMPETVGICAWGSQALTGGLNILLTHDRCAVLQGEDPPPGFWTRRVPVSGVVVHLL